MNDTPETPAEALKRVLAAKKAGAAGGGGGFKPAQHAEKAAQAKSAAMAKPAFKKASKRG
ncbi:hypothetical protein KOAAANKH_00614 [Brevundimonas sp. NIBR10]|jgi:hypothetical protein|uniref:hypothetical protein n=1 Tax=unclassified Brevundimonas TaxID=2622653 RepID=UPI0022F1906B|nr:hypothetical protein [Brevundimonas sp. NIBR10]WGM45750.1 hypothetical protein KOAAANKH_00614 [Brevundimonas sp. NIBR10]